MGQSFISTETLAAGVAEPSLFTHQPVLAQQLSALLGWSNPGGGSPAPSRECPVGWGQHEEQTGSAGDGYTANAHTKLQGSHHDWETGHSLQRDFTPHLGFVGELSSVPIAFSRLNELHGCQLAAVHESHETQPVPRGDHLLYVFIRAELMGEPQVVLFTAADLSSQKLHVAGHPLGLGSYQVPIQGFCT